MSRASAETSLALFDRMQGRGDVLSMHVEDGAKLAALPKEMFAEILYPLFQWWINGSKDEPSDPRDKMVFEGLKTHQIENAVKRGVNLRNWADNANKGGRPKATKKPSGNQEETKRAQLEDSRLKTEDASTSLLSCKSCSPTGSDISRGGHKPPAHVRPSGEAVEGARKLIANMTPNAYENIPQLLMDSGPNRGKIAGWARIGIVGRPFDATVVWIASKIYKNIVTSGFDGYSAEDFSLEDFDGDDSNGWRFMRKIVSLRDDALRGFAKHDRKNMEEDFKRAAVKLFYSSDGAPNEIVTGLTNLAKAYQAVR